MLNDGWDKRPDREQLMPGSDGRRADAPPLVLKRLDLRPRRALYLSAGARGSGRGCG
jgi:hypothetical protein